MIQEAPEQPKSCDNCGFSAPVLIMYNNESWFCNLCYNSPNMEKERMNNFRTNCILEKLDQLCHCMESLK